MKFSTLLKITLCAGFIVSMIYTQPRSASAAARSAAGQFPYQVSLRSSTSPTTVAEDIVVDGRIITAENYD